MCVCVRVDGTHNGSAVRVGLKSNGNACGSGRPSRRSMSANRFAEKIRNRDIDEDAVISRSEGGVVGDAWVSEFRRKTI